MATTRKASTAKPDTSKEKNDTPNPKPGQQTQHEARGNGGSFEAKILAELAKIRSENLEGHNQTLRKLETSMAELKGEMTRLERRTTEVEERVSATEDEGRRYERAIRYLLRREKDLTARYDDLQNRMRRNNMRIYRVPEGSEGRDVRKFVEELIHAVLDPMPDVSIQIERAHRSLTSEAKKPNDPPRSLIVRFLDFAVKEKILRQAWSQTLVYNDEQIYFDHDYSPELQRKRASVRWAAKQLKKKGIKAKCIYPAQLKLTMDTGEHTFSTLKDALPKLAEYNIYPKIGERTQVEDELRLSGWQVVGETEEAAVVGEPSAEREAIE